MEIDPLASDALAQQITRHQQVAGELIGLALDLLDRDRVISSIRRARADVVINAAAYTAVDRAESELELVHRLNALAPGVLAQEAKALGAWLVHYSTDYVFDGSGTQPWVETDPTGPLGVYGATKLAGERGIAAAGGQWAVMRTSWVFSAHGANFVKTMLRLGAERAELRVVADQHGGPTPAADIAAACLTMVRAMQADASRGGIYHFSGAPDTTWAGFAREIMAQAGLACRIADIASSDYPTPARRPANSRLDCAAIGRDFGIARPDWRAGLAKVLLELKP